MIEGSRSREEARCWGLLPLFAKVVVTYVIHSIFHINDHIMYKHVKGVCMSKRKRRRRKKKPGGEISKLVKYIAREVIGPIKPGRIFENKKRKKKGRRKPPKHWRP